MSGKRLRLIAAVLAGSAIVGSWSIAGMAQGPSPAPTAQARCARFPARFSTAFDNRNGRINLPWRTDFPITAPARPSFGDFQQDWQAYLGAVLAEIRASGFRIVNSRLTAPAGAEWWITPWMDYGGNGREPLIGLTRERNPSAGDLTPTSPAGRQVWAIGFYDRRGATALASIFADPCNPQVPLTGFQFPEGTVSFKFLFTTATGTDVPYLAGSPTVLAATTQSNPGQPRRLRLVQLDVAVKDSRASETGWVFGTFIWRGPRRGDGVYDNLVPVGLMWGNDPGVTVAGYDQFATLSQTRLNRNLDGVAWQGTPPSWQTRPWPGLQGRLNGPADNLRSSCISCHALAQIPRSALGIVPGGNIQQLQPPATRNDIVARYMTNTRSGSLVIPAEGLPSSGKDAARPFDYSLQLEAAVGRMCEACADGQLTGPTPTLCQIRGIPNRVQGANCPIPNPQRLNARPLSPPTPRQ